MQALILAAGLGRRLLPQTAVDTKCMVPVHGVPLIDRMLDILSEVPVARIVIVVGHGSKRVRAHVGDRWNGVPIVYLDNKEYAQTNNIYSLFLAAPLVQDEEVILLESDLIFDPAVITDLVADPRPDVAVVDRVEEWMCGTVMRLDSAGQVVGFGDSSDDAVAGEVFKTVNIYKFSAAFMTGWLIPQLTQRIEEIGRTEYYEEVLKQIVAMPNGTISALCLDGHDWYEIDTPEDLARAEALFPQKWNHYRRIMSRYGGYWRFPSLTDFCYLVNPFFPPTEFRQDLADRTPDLLSEYPSGQAVMAELAAEVFHTKAEHIAVGNGASELISALSDVLAERRVAVALPTFEEYAVRLQTQQVVSVFSGLTAGPERLQLLEEVDCDVMLVVNPDNPSGDYISRHVILDFVQRAAGMDRMVVVDDSFADFADEGKAGRVLTSEALQEENPNLVVIRSMGKSHGAAGLRLGVLASANGDIVAATRARLPVWNVNSLAEQFLSAVPSYENAYWLSCARVARERRHMAEALTAIGHGYPLASGANFLAYVLRYPLRSEEIAAMMLRRGFLVKDLSHKAGVGCEALRFAIRTRDENDDLVAALKESIGERDRASR